MSEIEQVAVKILKYDLQHVVHPGVQAWGCEICEAPEFRDNIYAYAKSGCRYFADAVSRGFSVNGDAEFESNAWAGTPLEGSPRSSRGFWHRMLVAVWHLGHAIADYRDGRDGQVVKLIDAIEQHHIRVSNAWCDRGADEVVELEETIRA